MYIFSYYYYFADKYYIYNIFYASEIYFLWRYIFVSKSRLTHNLWPQHAMDMWLRIKKLLCIVDIHVNFEILRHPANIKTCQRQHFN